MLWPYLSQTVCPFVCLLVRSILYCYTFTFDTLVFLDKRMHHDVDPWSRADGLQTCIDVFSHGHIFLMLHLHCFIFHTNVLCRCLTYDLQPMLLLLVEVMVVFFFCIISYLAQMCLVLVARWCVLTLFQGLSRS